MPSRAGSGTSLTGGLNHFVAFGLLGGLLWLVGVRLFPGACAVVGEAEDGFEPGQAEPSVFLDQVPEPVRDAGIDPGHAGDYRMGQVNALEGEAGAESGVVIDYGGEGAAPAVMACYQVEDELASRWPAPRSLSARSSRG